jgi:uncharacterized protein (TIGR03083 family)
MSTAEPISQIVPISRRSDASDVALAVYQQLLGLVDQLSPSDWTAETECTGWTVTDMVGHMLGAAQANASMRENIRQQLWGVRHRREYGGNPLDAANALQISDHARLSPESLTNALRTAAPVAVRGRMRLPGIARAITVPLSTSGSTASGMPRSVNLGYLVDVIYTRDVWMHTVDIARAVNQPINAELPVNGRVVADVVADWARRHGQPVDLVLSGPAGGHYRSAGGETVTPIEHDAIEFCRIVSGREPGDHLLATRVLF